MAIPSSDVITRGSLVFDYPELTAHPISAIARNADHVRELAVYDMARDQPGVRGTETVGTITSKNPPSK
jgi:hypothetical protein